MKPSNTSRTQMLKQGEKAMLVLKVKATLETITMRIAYYQYLSKALVCEKRWGDSRFKSQWEQKIFYQKLAHEKRWRNQVP